MISGPKILGDHDGDRISSAVTEGIRESLNAGRCRIGSDSRCSECIDTALNKNLSDIQAGGLKRRDETVAQSVDHKILMSTNIFSAAEQSRISIPQIQKTADCGEKL